MTSTSTDSGPEPDADESQAVLTTATIPCESFALAETFARVPEATFHCETTVECGDSVLPLVRVRAPCRAEVADALRADPTTEDVTALTDRGDEWLYRISWGDDVRHAVSMLTAEGGTVLGLAADNRTWTVRVLFPSRGTLGSTVSLCESQGISPEVRSIKHVGDGASGQYGLTGVQYNSLRLACERGYYKIPRIAKLDDLADEAGVSHQAYSERLRRATEGLVNQTLLNAAPTDGDI